MRIVAGTARGRRLEAPRGAAVRPTSDRVRESVFNSLQSLGALDGSVVVDLFAGTGALGLEARSRGAAEVHLVERDRSARAAIARNVESTGLADGVHLVPRDVLAAVAPEGDLAGVEATLVLADPPYAFDDWDRLLGAIAERWPDALVVVESDRELAVGGVPGLVGRRVAARRYGTTVVTFVHPR
jgi:16S rRNA (guanine966-N2)-methyltransferase